jgi:TatD DNase family protein
MIDAHCHLYSNKFDRDLGPVIQRARNSLEAVVISAVDPESLQKSLVIRRQHPDFIHVSAGVHPRNAARLKDEELTQHWQAIKNVRREIVAVGEVGPDFHRTKDSRLRQRQLLVLENALAQAESLDLPLVIHARQAEEAALEVVSRSRVPLLFHCFSGTRQTAKKIVGHGFYLSISAILLFNAELQKVVSAVPLDLILTETDSPALSPRPKTKRNEPAFLGVVVNRLAELLFYDPTKVAEITTANARRFYRLDA